MRAMFWDASSFNSDLSQWQTGKVTDMGGMFNWASSFNSDLSQWQTGKVTDMIGMFNGSGIDSQAHPRWYIDWSKQVRQNQRNRHS